MWRAWLALHETMFDRYDYNLLLGPDQDPGPQYSQNIRDMWIRLRKARVDVVGWNGTANLSFPNSPTSPSQIYAVAPGARATIIEVKRRLGPSNIGQITSYYHLWVTEYPAAVAPALRMVATQVSPNIAPAAAANGISIDMVTADFSVLRPLKS